MWEPYEELDEYKWKHLQEITKEHPARWMIWEDEPLPASVEKLHDMGINSLIFAPCMNRPEAGDFMDVMRQNIKNLQNLSRR
jgi:zinc transport system substrate-binding protein